MPAGVISMPPDGCESQDILDILSLPIHSAPLLGRFTTLVYDACNPVALTGHQVEHNLHVQDLTRDKGIKIGIHRVLRSRVMNDAMVSYQSNYRYFTLFVPVRICLECERTHGRHNGSRPPMLPPIAGNCHIPNPYDTPPSSCGACHVGTLIWPLIALVREGRRAIIGLGTARSASSRTSVSAFK